MKLNPIEKIRRTVQEASRPSLILFVLCCLGGFACLLTNFESVCVLFTGLMGVLWLSSIAFHSMSKRGGPAAGRRNPFTLLVVLCIIAGIGFELLFITRHSYLYNSYNEQNEPFNRFSNWLAEYISADAANQDFGYINQEYKVVLNDEITCNVIVTDRDYKVLYAQNSWGSGGSATLRPLICPSRDYRGNGLMILLDEKENVVGSFYVDEGWIDASMGEKGVSSLTLSDTAAARDPLYEKYFPSFGKYIDQEVMELTRNAICFESGRNGAETSDWTDETVDHILHTGEIYNEGAIIEELNGLTAEERDRFIEYLDWLAAARKTASNAAGGNSLHARTMSSADGRFHAFLLYEFDYDALYPHRASNENRRQFVYYYSWIAVCMIPAAIVFLAFWVFVDAKKRGQSNPALWAILTLIGNVIAWIIYMIVRPQMMKNPAGQTMPKGSCPICGTKLRSDFIACPGCGILLRSRCRNCGKALENDWSFCPYCTQAVVKEIPAAETAEQPEESASDETAE